MHPSAGQADSKDDGVLIRLEGDLDPEGHFSAQVLEVTKDEVRVSSPGQAPRLVVPLAGLKNARHEGLVGGGRLVLTAKDNARIPLLSYTLTVAGSFAEAARGIEQVARGEALHINLRKERTRCARCGSLLPEKDGICPRCIKPHKTFLRVAAYLGPYKYRALLLGLLSLVTTAINLAPPWLQGTLINEVLAPRKKLPLLFTLIGAWLACLAAASLIQVLSGRLIAFLASHIAADIRSGLYRSIEFLKLGFFDKKQVGSIISRVTNDTNNVHGFLVDGLPFFLTNLLLIVGILGFMLYTHWRLTLCILAPVPIVIGISALLFSRIRGRWHRWSRNWSRFYTTLNESLSGIRVMKAFAQEDPENRKFLGRNSAVRDAAYAVDRYWYTMFGAMTFFLALGLLVLWTYGGWLVYGGRMTLGDFWKFHAYLGLVYGPMQWFAMVNNWFSRAMAGAERIFEIMDSEREDYGDEAVHHPVQGDIAFEDVRFGYDKSNPVIKGMRFQVKAGEMIGLVGRSGSGKSTTISLLCRFYEPDGGTIRIDGVDAKTLSLKDLRRQVGVVLQEPFLFNGTIAENIRYGRPGASFEEVMEAAKAAHAHAFILAKPDGYDTAVGERGGKLSGGERQRISIARAILHNPRILILDEATSSVDVETEKQIQSAIANLVKNRTTFAIAHRLSTLRNANRLFVLDKGELVEQGTHEELLSKPDGLFAKLVATQSETNQIIAVGK